MAASLVVCLVIGFGLLYFSSPDEKAVTTVADTGELAAPPVVAEQPEEVDGAAAADAHPPEQGVHVHATATDEHAPEQGDHIHAVVREGETLGDMLLPWLTMSEIFSLSNASERVYSFSRMRAGQAYAVYMNAEGELARFEYEVDRENKIVVSREDGAWTATAEDIIYDIKLSEVAGLISSNLFNAVEDAGENAALAVMLSEIFAWEIDFIKAIQKGDSFRLLVEKRWKHGEFRGYGNILAAEFINQGITYDAYQFTNSTGGKTYFTSAGESLKRAFLKAPLAFKRISSPYNLKRFHPVLKTVKAHPAIDYAAPTGTPIMAIGDATVAQKGSSSGNGNYILLQHRNGYTSMYLHMSRFAKNIVRGGRVRQGDVIGYVGSTGLATGPHLCFRMKKDGNPVNPGKLLSPRDESVGKARMDLFIAERDILKGYFSGETALTEYSPEPRVSRSPTS